MRQVKVQWRHRNEPVIHCLEVGDMTRTRYSGREAEPEIWVAARVGALHDAQPAIVMKSLAAHAHPLDGLGRERGEVYVDQRARRKGVIEHGPDDLCGKGLGRRKGNDVALPSRE